MTDTEEHDPLPPIVVGTDGSKGSDLAVRWAADAAALRRRPLHIVLGADLATTRSMRGKHTPFLEEIRRRGHEILERSRTLALRIAPSLTVQTELSDTGPAELLIERSATAEQTVVGSAGESSTLTHLGSTLLAVTAHGHGNIVVVRGSRAVAGRYGRPVVVGLDGSSSSAAAAAAAFAEADLRGCPVVAVHTRHDLRAHWFTGIPETMTDPALAEAADTDLRGWLEPWSQRYPRVEVSRKTYLAGPDLRLIQWSESAQLVVVGSRGRGGLRGLILGSTSNIVVQRTHCPVLVAHRT